MTQGIPKDEFERDGTLVIPVDMSKEDLRKELEAVVSTILVHRKKE